MPSSTSSSSESPARISARVWIYGLGAALLCLVILEMGGRALGVQPTIIPNDEFWSYHRSRVYAAGRRTLVTLGASRIQCGFSSEVFAERFPDHEIVRLELFGSSAVPTLKDLAADERFQGIILYSATAETLSGTFARDRQQQQLCLDVYHRSGNLSDHRLNEVASALIRSRLTCMNVSKIRKRNLFAWLFSDARLRSLSDRVWRFDRSCWEDFDARTLDELETMRHGWAGDVRICASLVAQDPAAWDEDLKELTKTLDILRRRGVRVAFVRFPTSGPALEFSRRYCPRERYWDRISEVTGCPTIHFEDLEWTKGLECPDGSHLDHHTAPGFTRALLDELVRLGVLEEGRTTSR